MLRKRGSGWEEVHISGEVSSCERKDAVVPAAEQKKHSGMMSTAESITSRSEMIMLRGQRFLLLSSRAGANSLS